MFVKTFATLFCCLLMLADACGSKSGSLPSAQTASAVPASAALKPESPGPVNPAATKPAPGACSLVEMSEVAAVQGARVQHAQPNSQETGDLAISQCYYTASSADGSKNLSVHLQVTRAARKGDAEAIKEFWESSFERKKGERGEEEGEKESAEPLRVSGIGDESFWMGNSKVGALYVLKGDNIVRVSVGGPEDAKSKIEKSKQLAAKALKRLG
jgi:hypothetical protein